MRLSTIPSALLSVVFLSSTLAVGCSNSTSSVDPSTGAYREAGPWAAGVTTLPLGDRFVEVWYPTTASEVDGLEPEAYFIRDDLPEFVAGLIPEEINPPFVTDAYRDVTASADGPFPLVLFSHGAASYRNQSTFLTAHLASWGFVVMSADYLERGLAARLGQAPETEINSVDLSRMVVALAEAENQRAGGLLEGSISTDAVAITGHSAGGGTSVAFGGEPEVVTYIPLSAGVSSDGSTDLPDTPSLWLTGSIDGIISADRSVAGFEQAPPPARSVVIDNMGHLGPSDICTIGESGGGVIALAIEAGLGPLIPESFARLGTDGCQPEALPIEDGWPVIRHFVTAQLRWAFGIDAEPIGLTQESQGDFPEATFDYDERLE